jgi:hypothetical protein
MKVTENNCTTIDKAIKIRLEAQPGMALLVNNLL